MGRLLDAAVDAFGKLVRSKLQLGYRSQKSVFMMIDGVLWYCEIVCGSGISRGLLRCGGRVIWF